VRINVLTLGPLRARAVVLRKKDVTVQTPSFGPVTGDIAFGGAFYF
jgi:proline racemase